VKHRRIVNQLDEARCLHWKEMISCLLVAVPIFLNPSVLLGETFTNWPTYGGEPLTNWPKASEYDQLVRDLTWTHSALVERCVVAGVSTNGIQPATSGTRCPKDDVQRFKDKAKNLIEEFVDTDMADEDGTFRTHFSTADYPDDLPMLTISQVCVHLHFPTNYYDFTPVRGLNGLGPSWTNSCTANGGTNFPPGQSTWYTTHYGYPGMTSAISLLRWTSKAHSAGDGIPYNERGVFTREWCDKSEGWSSGMGTNNWQFSVYWARWHLDRTNSSKWKTEDKKLGWQMMVAYLADDYASPWGWSLWTGGSYGDYEREARGGWKTTGMSKSCEHSADLYGKTITEYSLTGDNVPTPNYNAGEYRWFSFDGVTNDDQYAYIESLTDASTNARYSSVFWSNALAVVVTDTNQPFQPNDPGYAQYWDVVWKQRAGDSIWVLKWDGTNGFQYK